MHRILLPVDADPDRARGQAAFVADLPTAPANIETVVTHSLTADEIDAPDELQSVERVETVRVARDYLEERDVAVELAEGRLPPADGILELAEEFDVDHIVMGSRKQSPTGKAVFGSVAQKVVLDTTLPVTIVSAREE